LPYRKFGKEIFFIRISFQRIFFEYKNVGVVFGKSTPPFIQKPACFLKLQAGFLFLLLGLFGKAGESLGVRQRHN
jgi:hypothetical protein